MITKSIQDVIAELPPDHVEGQHWLKVKMSPELMDRFTSRTIEGYRVRWDWGKPDAEGFYVPTASIDWEDRLFALGSPVSEGSRRRVSMNREPIAIIGVIEVAAVALVSVLATVLEWDEPLTASIIAAASAVIIAIGTIWQRSRVDSPATVAAKVEEALQKPPTG